MPALRVGAYPDLEVIFLLGVKMIGVRHLPARLVVVDDELDEALGAEALQGAVGCTHDATRRLGDIGF